MDPTAILTDAELAEIDSVSVHQYQILLKENKKLGNQLRSLEGELEIAKSQILVLVVPAAVSLLPPPSSLCPFIPFYSLSR